MTETIILTSKNTLTKTITETIDLRPLKDELTYINSQIAELEKQPDEITVPNDVKFAEINLLNIRKEIINKFLSVK